LFFAGKVALLCRVKQERFSIT